MDLDFARSRIMQAPDVPALSDVVLELLTIVGQLDSLVAASVQRVQILEEGIATLQEQIDTPDWRQRR